MKRGAWRRAEALFHAALEHSAENRAAFLAEACADDDELRRQVETLIAKDEQAGSFLEPPVLASLAAGEQPRPSLAGRQFGAYRIQSLLGAGGMGEVYRAHDTKLGRDVAVKTLPPEFAGDPERLARFQREARTLASLNHPNIAAIYGLEESEDLDFLVLELVEGDALHGPLPLADALDCALQLADALEAAHEHGIVHRDLKPANIKVTPRGVVKVLDFGLAKPLWETAAPDPARSGAVTVLGSVAGHIVGTPGYMSPEQARGAEVDQRADIWAFGCLLYELIAGRRAFGSETVPGAIAAVLSDDPDWSALPAETPPAIHDLLRRCLDKDPNRRLNTISGARAVLEDAWRQHARRSRQRSRGVQLQPDSPPAGAPAPPLRPDSRRKPAGGTSRARTGRVRTLAVLPLSNFARDPEQDYFVDGMTEALIAELAQIRALRVISRTSVMHFKGSTKTLPEIARELGADGIVEGSVMRVGERVRITAQLIHAPTDRHLWARSYERDVRDVLGLQSDVARAIAGEIKVTVTPQERARLDRVRSVNVEAHEAYVRGRYEWARANLDRSIEHFERAIAIDPDYALAYAGIADARSRVFGAAFELVPPGQAAPLVRSAAVKALELDESLSEPHVSLSRVLLWYDRDPVAAERELRRAIQLNPNSAMAHFIIGLLFADLKRNNEAMAALQHALQLDPVSAWNSTIGGFFMCRIGHEQAGREQLRKAIELDGSFYLARSLLSVVDCYAGRFPDATAGAEEGLRLSGGLPIAHAYVGYVLAMAGRPARTHAMLEALEEASRQRYVPSVARAWCYAGLRDYERTLEWLEKGYQQHDSQLPHLRVLGAFDPMLPDPRYQDLLRRQGLPV